MARQVSFFFSFFSSSPDQCGFPDTPESHFSRASSDTPTLLSINRFEGKKNIALAVEAFAKVRQDHPRLRLIVAGESSRVPDSELSIVVVFL